MIQIPIKIPEDSVAPIKLRPVMPSCMTNRPGIIDMITSPSAPPSDMYVDTLHAMTS